MTLFRISTTALLLCAGLPAAPAGAVPTFSKDVASILYQRCVECHRAGELAPIAFTTYQEVRPWAKAIKQAVLTHTMPPWLADPHYSAFQNDRTMPQRDAKTIVAWVNGGAPEGDPKDMPPMPQYADGWNIGKPDAVFDIGTDFDVPAEGVVRLQVFLACLRTSPKTSGWKPPRSGPTNATPCPSRDRLRSGSRRPGRNRRREVATCWWASRPASSLLSARTRHGETRESRLHVPVPGALHAQRQGREGPDLRGVAIRQGAAEIPGLHRPSR